MSEEIAKIDLYKKQRAAFKGQLTYFKNQCSTVSPLGAYESVLRRIQLVYDNYNSVQVKLEALDDSTASARDSFEDSYGNLESMLLNKIHELKKADDNSATASFQNSSIHEVSPENSVSMGIRLRELKLPSFNGSESEWLAFRDIFVDLIHSKTIAPTIKFVYLISQIRSGSAYSLIEHLPVTAENYDIAWKTICVKYNNEIAIQKFHMREIYDIKGQLENSSKALQLFIDKAVKHYNALKSLKVNVGEWDLNLTHHLMQKLDNAPAFRSSFKKTYQSGKDPRSATSSIVTSSNATSLEQDVPSSDQVYSCNPHTSLSGASTLNPVSLNSSQLSFNQRIVLLGTALVNTTASNGNQTICRALLDSGSHMNFITTDACDRLKTKRHPTNKTIAGIGGKESIIRHKIYLTISSRVSDYHIKLKFYVLPKITNTTPSLHVKFNTSTVPVDLKLADPYFNVPDRIDLLLGVEVYNQLFSGESITILKELPSLHNTELGYVVCGKAERSLVTSKPTQSHAALCSMQILEKQLKQFWELEHIPVKSTYSSEENLCEQHYCNNVKRLPVGRYSVALPVKSNIVELGSSHLAARRQFLSLEKRLRYKEELHQQYREFMSEYIALGHMVPVTNFKDVQTNYLPHHYVLKEQSTTTKLRVVFNASSKTSSQLSVNDCLMVGPTIQQDLFSIVLRFRNHNFAFCGDIAKMYRQILVHDDQQDLQRIWWRDQPSDASQIFKLRTVTYAALKTIASDFYVDDVLTGASTIKEALELKSELIKLLELGGFELRKFWSNDTALSSENQPTSPITLVLGLSWNTDTDNFEAPLDKLSVSSYGSKRSMLSEICQLFDPLGLCAPIIVTAKLFMQMLWSLQNIGWGDPIPDNIAGKWIKFKTELNQLQKITVPRCISGPDIKRLELHGFADASERAFGCLFYVRLTDTTDRHRVQLLCAKSRVAPLKKQTIPRLELCAALLLAEMTTRLLSIMNLSLNAVYLWSDSEITLYRIRSDSHKYATFVANRISKIQEHTSSTNWYYVSSAANPADLVSRGLMPSEFLGTTLWWNGPEYLWQSEKEWPNSSNPQLSVDLEELEARKTVVSALSQTKPVDQTIFNRFECLTTLLRVVAYILRFWQNANVKIIPTQSLRFIFDPVKLTAL